MHLASEQAAGTSSAAPGQENPDDLFDLVEGEAVDSGHVAAGGSGGHRGDGDSDEQEQYLRRAADQAVADASRSQLVEAVRFLQTHQNPESRGGVERDVMLVLGSDSAVDALVSQAVDAAVAGAYEEQPGADALIIKAFDLLASAHHAGRNCDLGPRLRALMSAVNATDGQAFTFRPLFSRFLIEASTLHVDVCRTYPQQPAEIADWLVGMKADSPRLGAVRIADHLDFLDGAALARVERNARLLKDTTLRLEVAKALDDAAAEVDILQDQGKYQQALLRCESAMLDDRAREIFAFIASNWTPHNRMGLQSSSHQEFDPHWIADHMLGLGMRDQTLDFATRLFNDYPSGGHYALLLDVGARTGEDTHTEARAFLDAYAAAAAPSAKLDRLKWAMLMEADTADANYGFPRAQAPDWREHVDQVGVHNRINAYLRGAEYALARGRAGENLDLVADNVARAANVGEDYRSLAQARVEELITRYTLTDAQAQRLIDAAAGPAPQAPATPPAPAAPAASDAPEATQPDVPAAGPERAQAGAATASTETAGTTEAPESSAAAPAPSTGATAVSRDEVESAPVEASGHAEAPATAETSAPAEAPASEESSATVIPAQVVEPAEVLRAASASKARRQREEEEKARQAQQQQAVGEQPAQPAHKDGAEGKVKPVRSWALTDSKELAIFPAQPGEAGEYSLDVYDGSQHDSLAFFSHDHVGPLSQALDRLVAAEYKTVVGQADFDRVQQDPHHPGREWVVFAGDPEVSPDVETSIWIVRAQNTEEVGLLLPRSDQGQVAALFASISAARLAVTCLDLLFEQGGKDKK